MKTLKIQTLALMVIGLSAFGISAQGNAAKTVTNADMEKYRQARVKADEEYRQNYQRLGLPSPEELERREVERQKRFDEFSEKLKAQQLQKEYLERLNSLTTQTAPDDRPQIIYLDQDGNYGPVYSTGYTPYLFFGNRRHSGFGAGFNQKYPPSIQMVKDQADMFPSATWLIDQRKNQIRFKTPHGGARRVFSPRQ
jgi:hypothetical protein